MSSPLFFGNTGTDVRVAQRLYGLPFNKIAELFQSLAGLAITEGALAQALQRMSEWLDVESDVILAAIRASPLIPMDETGWNVSGIRHWLWAAVNKRLAFYRIARSRGAKAHEVMMSLLHTLRLQDKDPLAFFKKAILCLSQGNPIPILSIQLKKRDNKPKTYRFCYGKL